MPTERDKPFIVATWLTKLLSGENSCEWATWFKAHYQRQQAETVPSRFNFTAWRIAHTTLLVQLRGEFANQSYTVTTERQNNFFLRGKTATLSGTPDLIAIKHTQGVIIDAKTGRVSAAHPVQVALYMYAVPRALQQHRGIDFSGLVAYPDQRTEIAPSAVNEAFLKSLTHLIGRVSNSNPAIKVSSAIECGFCDISQKNCPERAASDERPIGDTEDF